jgi:hypothetical protein
MEPGRPYHDCPFALVIAQQYSSSPFDSLCSYSRKEKKIRHAYDKCHYFTFLHIWKDYVIQRVSVLRKVGKRLPSDVAPYPSWMKCSKYTVTKASELERKFVFVVNNAREGGKNLLICINTFSYSSFVLWQYSGKINFLITHSLVWTCALLFGQVWGTLLVPYSHNMPIPVSVRAKSSVCDRLLAGMTGSNPAGGLDVSLLWVLCVVR